MWSAVTSGTGGRAGSKVSTAHVFSLGELAAAVLLGDRAGVRGTRARVKCELRLLLGSMATGDLLGVGLGPKGLETHF